MFSGIIEYKSEILQRDWWVFRIKNHFPDTLILGQSIAHDGACMTLTRIEPEFYEFFMMEESLRVTTFWTKKVWDRVNVERSIRVWDRIDGHFVTGHVDAVWKVILLDKIPDNSLIIGIEYPREYMRYIIQKGSITVNGTSLTVVEDSENTFTVSLIPLTQDWTNLWTLQIWDLVNLEFDMMAKYMLKNLELRT